MTQQTPYIFGQKRDVDPPPDDRRHIIGLVQDNKLAEATKYCESLVPSYPQSFVLFYSLGMSCILLGEYQKSYDYLQRAVKINAGHDEAWRYLGDACIKLERLEEGHGYFQKSLGINPQNKESRRGIIQSAIDPNNFYDSVKEFEERVKADPENPHLLLALGQCYMEQEKYKAAIRNLEKAASLLPDDTTITTLVGQAYAGFHKPIDALQWYQKAYERDEQARASLLMLMATAAKDKGDFDQSIAYAEEAIAHNPEGAGPKNNLAHIHTILGDKSRARELRSEVMAAHPEDRGAVMAWAHNEKMKEGDPAIAVLEKFYARETRNHFEEKEKMNVGFALAKAYGDIGTYGKSIEVLKFANAVRREVLEYDFEREVEHYDLIKHVFKPITPDDVRAPQEGERKMIFILGMPRSGTTLTEQIISSHSAVYGAGELNFMNEETAELMYMFSLQPEVKLEKVAFEHIGPGYLGHIESLGMRERIVTDKLPHNFLRLGYILGCFPDAKVIHLNRDPVAVCFSCFQKFFPARGMGFTFNMRDLGLYYGMYLDLMDYWREKFPGRILDLDYRTLTEDQEGQTRMLLDYCELDWEDQCLEFYNTRRGVLTASQTQVREKMYQGSSETWKKYRDHLGELLEALDEAGVEYDKG